MWSASRDYLMLAQEVLTRLKVKPITKTKGEGARVVGESVGEVPVTVGARPRLCENGKGIGVKENRPLRMTCIRLFRAG